jgi:hypothetical protein
MPSLIQGGWGFSPNPQKGIVQGLDAGMRSGATEVGQHPKPTYAFEIAHLFSSKTHTLQPVIT